MFSDIENLKIIGIHKGISKIPGKVVDRKYNSLILRMNGIIKYSSDDFEIEAKKGDIVFMPTGISYIGQSLSDEQCEYLSVSFHADLKDAKPSVHSFENFSDGDEFINSIADLWRFGAKAEHYKCYSLVYNLISYLEFLDKQSYVDKNKLSIITPAVTYLKKHIYDCNLKTDALNELCNISGVYFRKIFNANFGMSPQKYILTKRLSHAKTIIDTGDYNSISEVASQVGYNDPLYFSRAFKKKYGLSPTEYAKS